MSAFKTSVWKCQLVLLKVSVLVFFVDAVQADLELDIILLWPPGQLIMKLTVCMLIARLCFFVPCFPWVLSRFISLSFNGFSSMSLGSVMFCFLSYKHFPSVLFAS